MSDANYNYDVFSMAREEPVFSAFPGHPRAGQRAPVHDLYELESDQRVSMKSLWSSGPAIFEFGSFT